MNKPNSLEEFYLLLVEDYFCKKLNYRRTMSDDKLYSKYKGKLDRYLSKIKDKKSQKKISKNIFLKGEQGYMTKNEARLNAFGLIERFGLKARTKFNNINGKTGQYDVPSELFQKRTSRKNRVLIPWKSVYKNKLTIEKLETFEGGITVEFVNEDFFTSLPISDPLYNVFEELKQRIGSDAIVSSIISIRSEGGSSSSQIQRDNFAKLLNNTQLLYKDSPVTVNNINWRNFIITKVHGKTNMYNDGWSGFLYVNIRGGQQDTVVSHPDNITIFNPAQEYLNAEMGLDLDLVVSYFALLSIDEKDLVDNSIPKVQFFKILDSLKYHLKNSYYNYEEFHGNLLDYCNNHPSVRKDDELLMSTEK